MNINEYEFECGDCISKPVKLVLGDESTIMVHMIKAHGYEPEQVATLIQWYHDDVPQTDDGEVLFDCSEHGEYTDVCYGCEAVDEAIDRWKETRNA